MKLRSYPLAVLLAGCTACWTGDACAQNTGVAGNLGQNQQNGLGQASLGIGGQNGRGQGGIGQGGLGGQQPGGQGGLQNRGQQRTRTDGFIGSDAQQVQNLFRNQQNRRGRRGGFDFTIENLNEMRRANRGRGGRQNQSPPVRVQLKPLFRVAQPSSAELSTRVQSGLSKALPASAGSTPQVSVNGGVATVQGQVTSEYDKQLVAKMVSLQPGISKVENQLRVQSGQDQPMLMVPVR